MLPDIGGTQQGANLVASTTGTRGIFQQVVINAPETRDVHFSLTLFAVIGELIRWPKENASTHVPILVRKL